MWKFLKKCWKFGVGLLGIQAVAGVKIDSNVLSKTPVEICTNSRFSNNESPNANYPAFGYITMSKDYNNPNDKFSNISCKFSLPANSIPDECNVTGVEVLIRTGQGEQLFKEYLKVNKNEIVEKKYDLEELNKKDNDMISETRIFQDSFFCKRKDKSLYLPPITAQCKIENNNTNIEENNMKMTK